jgi:hypothetical protein
MTLECSIPNFPPELADLYSGPNRPRIGGLPRPAPNRIRIAAVSSPRDTGGGAVLVLRGSAEIRQIRYRLWGWNAPPCHLATLPPSARHVATSVPARSRTRGVDARWVGLPGAAAPKWACLQRIRRWAGATAPPSVEHPVIPVRSRSRRRGCSRFHPGSRRDRRWRRPSRTRRPEQWGHNPCRRGRPPDHR